MTETKRPLKVFLSYASQDKSLVQGLSRRLKSEGWIDPWLDVKKLLPGQDWRVKIEEAVETADIVIICLSNNSVTKEGYVQKELRYAREIALEKPEETIFLIPLRLDECEVPRGLRFYQWVDYFGGNKETSYRALVESLKLRYEQKLKLEEAEHARKEKLERESAERIAREKEAREAAERTSQEDVDREHVKKEAAEKAQLEVEEKTRQKVIKDKIKHEATDIAAREYPGADRKTEEQKKVLWYSGWTYSIGIIVVLIIAIYLNSPLIEQWLSPPPYSTKVATPSITISTPPTPPSPTSTLTTSVIPTPSVEMLVSTCIYAIQAEDESLLTIGDKFGVDYRSIEYYYGVPNFSIGELVKIPNVKQDTCINKDGLPEEMNDSMGVEMVLVLAGDFVMGNEDDAQYNVPERTVSLETFYIDRYEVTNALYKACVDTGNCTAPTNNASETRTDYYGTPEFDNYPVIYVNWDMAKDYCEWRGARLPTNAEWEKAARDADERIFPWGDDIDDTHANYNGTDTVAVGSYEIGRSPVGAYDMAGNVWEWVSSSDGSYTFNPEDNIRGGSWVNDQELNLRSYFQGFATSQYDVKNYFGFRCASDNINIQPLVQPSE